MDMQSASATPAQAVIPSATAPRFVTIRQASELRPAFTQAALRDLVFKSTARLDSKGRSIPGNGLAEAGAILRVGRKVLLDLAAFDRWLESHRVGGKG